MKLYVIRHGETEQGKNRIIANLSEPLNKKGMNQAINVGKKLRKLDLDIIYCSPIERAKHTLKLFDLDRSIPVLIEDRLKERDMGIYENIPFDNLDWNVFWNYNSDRKYPELESMKDVYQRIKEFLDELNLTGSENFMDAGWGEGHVAIKALEEYITDGCVYALDMYEPSIEDMLKYKQENNADNLIPIVSNIAEHIDLDDETLDVVLMVNVFHGFKATRTLDEAVDELARVIKTDSGRIAIMDYKKQDVKNGPPIAIRSSPDDLQELFSAHGLKMTYLNEEIGEDIPEGKSHYLIIFEKE